MSGEGGPRPPIVPGGYSAERRSRSRQHGPKHLSDDFPEIPLDNTSAEHRQVARDVANRVGLGDHVSTLEVAPPARDITGGEGAAGPASLEAVRDVGSTAEHVSRPRRRRFVR